MVHMLPATGGQVELSAGRHRHPALGRPACRCPAAALLVCPFHQRFVSNVMEAHRRVDFCGGVARHVAARHHDLAAGQQHGGGVVEAGAHRLGQAVALAEGACRREEEGEGWRAALSLSGGTAGGTVGRGAEQTAVQQVSHT